jgi:hypothetical protein
MKRYIRCTEIPKSTLDQAVEFAEGFKGSTVDLANHRIVIPFGPDSTVEFVMDDGMLGKWFADNGFDISFEKRDVQYLTKGEFNTRSMIKYKGRPAYLRNRLVMTATW